MPWSSHSCNDCKYQYFTRNICNRYDDSFKTLFRTRSQACCAIVTTIWRQGLTKIKLHMKSSPAFPIFLSAYSYRLFEKFNRDPLNYSLGALCRFPSGGYTHAALGTVYNQLTIRQVFKTIEILWSLELLCTRSTLRVGLPDV